MFTDIEFWTPELIEKEELSNICKWLGAWQAACVSGDSIASDYVEKAEDLPSQQLDPAFKKGMHNVQALIRHLHALKDNLNARLKATESKDEIKFLTKFIKSLEGTNG